MKNHLWLRCVCYLLVLELKIYPGFRHLYLPIAWLVYLFFLDCLQLPWNGMCISVDLDWCPPAREAFIAWAGWSNASYYLKTCRNRFWPYGNELLNIAREDFPTLWGVLLLLQLRNTKDMEIEDNRYSGLLLYWGSSITCHLVTETYLTIDFPLIR